MRWWIHAVGSVAAHLQEGAPPRQGVEVVGVDEGAVDVEQDRRRAGAVR